MTQDEIIEMAQECNLIGMRPHLDGIYTEALETFAKLVAAKAIAELESQEPLAWMDADGNVSDNNDHKCFPIPLYTHPPQRTEPPDWFPAVENILNEYGLQAIDFVADFKAAMKDAEKSQRTWVGLTDEEIEEGIKQSWVTEQAFQSVAWWAEAKLKDKNCAG